MKRPLLALSILAGCAPAGPGLVATAPVTAPPTTTSTSTSTSTSTTTTIARPATASGKAGWWARLRECESGGDYANKSNPHYRGAYQMAWSTWEAMGGTGDPADASPDEQDMRAEMLLAAAGAGQWPTCGKRM